MKTKDGDTVKSLLNGKYYKVKRIVKSMAVNSISPDCVSTMFSDQFRIKEVLNKWILKADAHFIEVLKVQAWVMGGVIVNLIVPIQLVKEKSNIAESSTS